MSETKRSRYQQEMDQVQLSEEKAGETLRMMLEANGKLREEQIQKAGRPKSAVFLRRVLPVMAAAAACVALVIFGLNRPGGVTFGSVRMRDLPVSGISRAEDAVAADFETAFGCTAESLFPGWTVSSEKTLQSMKNAEARYESSLIIEKQGTALNVNVVKERPAIYRILSEKLKVLENKVLLNLDPDDGVRYAVTQTGELYVTLSSPALSEKDFIKTVEEITGPWKAKGS